MNEKPRATASARTQARSTPVPGRNLVELVLLWVALVAMAAGNAYSEIAPLNGVTAAGVSNEIFSWFAPAGYVFSIWSVIYAGLAVWLVRLSMLRHKYAVAPERFTAQGAVFILSCLLNLAWIAAWHYRLFALSVAIILALLACVATLYSNARRWATSPLDWVPLSLYFSWLVVATIANTAYLVTYLAPGIPSVAWIVITFVLLGLVLAIAFNMNRSFRDPAYGLVALWAAVGLGVRLMAVSMPVGISILVVCAAGAVAIYLPIATQDDPVIQIMHP